MASNLTRLEDKLDELLVEYLTALSTYIAAQEKLASQLKNVRLRIDILSSDLRSKAGIL